MNLDSYILSEKEKKTWHELALDVNKRFGTAYHGESLRKYYQRNLKERNMSKKKDSLERDRKLDRLSESEKSTKKKYEEAKEYLKKLEAEFDALAEIQEYKPFEILPKVASGKSESVVIALASDWHIEELVELSSTNGLNEYNLAIAKDRATQYFKSILRLTEIFQKDTRIDTMVLALLGDFISGSIHEDIAENTALGPTKALIFAEELLISGIQFLLANSKLNLVIPCHSGNHGRATKEQRMATENENSFEYYMYHVIAQHFRGNDRVRFLISESYVSYLPVFDKTIRFHHGHGLRFGGGVGGLFIPAYKAIARWNNGRRADIDCFGHFHQFVDGGSFVCNGSVIGYNAYGVSRGFSYEPPQQVVLVVEKSRGRTFTCPVKFK